MPLALMAWEYGPTAPGAASVLTTSRPAAGGRAVEGAWRRQRENGGSGATAEREREQYMSSFQAVHDEDAAKLCMTTSRRSDSPLWWPPPLPPTPAPHFTGLRLTSTPAACTDMVVRLCCTAPNAWRPRPSRWQPRGKTRAVEQATAVDITIDRGWC